MKKQIKQVRIEINTQGAKDAENAIAGINKELDQVTLAAKAMDAELGRSVATLESLYNRAAPLSAALTTAATAAGKLGRSLNGGTAKAEKGVSSYMDNLDLLSLSLKSVEEQSTRTTASLGNISNKSTTEDMDLVIEALHGISAGMQELIGVSKDTAYNTKKTMKALHDLGATADRTEEEIQQLNYETNQAGIEFGTMDKKGRKARKGLEGLGRTAGRTGKHLSKMAHGGGGLAGTYAVVAANIFALSESFRILTEAANLDRLLTQTASFSAAVSGINVKELARDMSDLSGSILSVKESMQFAVKGAAFNFTTEQLRKLTIGARKSSIALGIDFTDAMDRVMRGISKQEIELFDELGVVTRLIPAFKKYAQMVNKSVEELSDYERQVALTNEVQAQLDERFSGIEVYATGWELLGKAVKDFTDKSLMGVADALDGVAKSMANLLSFDTDSFASIEESMKVLDSVKNTGTEVDAGKQTVAISELGNALRTYIKLSEKSSDATASLESGATILAGSLSLGTLAFIYYTNAAAAATAGTTIFAGALAAVAAIFTPVILGALAVSAAITAVTYALVAPIAQAEALQAARESMAVKAKEHLAAEVAYQAGLKAIEDKGVDIAAVRSQAKANTIKRFEDLRELYSKTGDKRERKRILKRVQEARTEQEEFLALLGERGNAIIQSGKAMDDSRDKLSALADTSARLVSPVSEALKQVSAFTLGVATNYGDGGKIQASVKDSTKKFNELAEAMVFKKAPFGESIKSAEDLENVMKKIHEAELNLKATRAISVAEGKLAGKNSVELLFDRMKITRDLLSLEKKAGGIVSKRTRELRDMLAVSDASLNILREKLRVTEELEELNQGMLVIATIKSGQFTKQSELLTDSILKAKEEYKIRIDNTSLTEEALARIKLLSDREITILKIKRAQNIELEKYIDKVLVIQKLQDANAIADVSTVGIAEALGTDTNVDRNSRSQRDLSLEVDSARLGVDEANRTGSDTEIQAAETLLAIKQQELDVATKLAGLASVNDLSDKFAELSSSMSSLDLTGLQTQFMSTFESITVGIGSLTESFKLFSDSTGDVGFLDTLSFGFDSLFTAMTEGTKDMADEQISAVQSTVDMISSIGQMGMDIFQELSKGKVIGIDTEIAAEKKRDGKSAESLAKIKKLEAKKIKEEAKAKKASVIMSTSMAIMQGYAQLGPIAGSVAAAGMTILGALQLSNIDKAASGQIAALDGGGASGMKITGGTRSNDIDVSKQANAGEMSFISGASGIGSSGNFQTPGRAGFGSIEAGRSTVVGETGPEVITPTVPVSVSSTGSSSSSTINFAPVFNAQAVDSNGMADLFQNYSKELYEGLEREMAANNQTLASV